MDLNSKLINEVKKHECIYNINSEHYNHFEYKEEMWRQIGKTLSIPRKNVHIFFLFYLILLFF